ncbi:MAG: ABC transporter ATP-binding protein [Nocardioidaceae bacterium]|nr:ABC transporter ATP-binding protein [Nocardioidaceae bacterium]
MALHVTDLHVTFGSKAAVDGVDLTMRDGEVLAVLGPSGCGKSTLLRAIAGLEQMSGKVEWDGENLEATPTHRRGFALMFQDGQLFDHLTAAGNIGYARRLRGESPQQVRGDVDALLELVGLDGLGDRLPRTLSGGERQRVALARCLAAKPRLLLLDEPLSALDAELRVRLADDLRRILTETGTTALLVTHDQEEAYAVADRLAVMRAGRIVQEGATDEVWSHPVDAPTALFLGYAHVLDGDAAATLLAVAGESPTGSGPVDTVAVRASAVLAAPAGADAAAHGTRAEVIDFVLTPDGSRLKVRVDGVGELQAVGVPGWFASSGETASVSVDRRGIALIEATLEQNWDRSAQQV